MRKGLIFIIVLLFNFIFIYGINSLNTLMADNDFMIYFKGKPVIENEVNNPKDEEIFTDYKGESIENITKKMEKFFIKTQLEGYGEKIASISVQKNVNPYLVAGIILESTSCKINCSVIFNECHNVFSNKGKPGCFGGTYRVYNSVEDSIEDLVSDVKNRFPQEDDQVPSKMFKSYEKNATWAFKVSTYMEELKKIK